MSLTVSAATAGACVTKGGCLRIADHTRAASLRVGGAPVALYVGVLRRSDDRAYADKPDFCGDNLVAPRYAIGVGEHHIIDVIGDDGCLREELAALSSGHPAVKKFFKTHVKNGEDYLNKMGSSVSCNAWLANEPSSNQRANSDMLEFDIMTPLSEMEGELFFLGLFLRQETRIRTGLELTWCYGGMYERDYQTSCVS